MVSTTSTRVLNTTNEETANNKSCFSGRRRPNSAYSSHQPLRDEEVSGESCRKLTHYPFPQLRWQPCRLPPRLPCGPIPPASLLKIPLCAATLRIPLKRERF